MSDYQAPATLQDLLFATNLTWALVTATGAHVSPGTDWLLVAATIAFASIGFMFGFDGINRRLWSYIGNTEGLE